MNWAAWGPTVIAVVTAIYTAGAVVGRIKGQERTIARHDNHLKQHDDVLSTHAVQIAKAESWREGYAAGKIRGA